MEQPMNVNEDAGGQSRLTVRLGTWHGGFAGFISECESLQKDLELKNPYNAAADYERVSLLIEIAKKWHGGYGA